MLVSDRTCRNVTFSLEHNPANRLCCRNNVGVQPLRTGPAKFILPESWVRFRNLLYLCELQISLPSLWQCADVYSEQLWSAYYIRYLQMLMYWWCSRASCLPSPTGHGPVHSGSGIMSFLFGLDSWYSISRTATQISYRNDVDLLWYDGIYQRKLSSSSPCGARPVGMQGLWDTTCSQHTANIYRQLFIPLIRIIDFYWVPLVAVAEARKTILLITKLQMKVVTGIGTFLLHADYHTKRLLQSEHHPVF